MDLSKGIGGKLLTKMGWSAGTGLGARRDGRVDPLRMPVRPEKLGVGAERRPFQEAWWETTLAAAYGSGGAADVFAACGKRRCRPHGSAKLARLEAQEKQSVCNVGIEDVSEEEREALEKTERKAVEKAALKERRKAARKERKEKLRLGGGAVGKKKKTKRRERKVRKEKQKGEKPMMGHLGEEAVKVN